MEDILTQVHTYVHRSKNTVSVEVGAIYIILYELPNKLERWLGRDLGGERFLKGRFMCSVGLL